MDLDQVGASEFGLSLKGFGLNILVKDVPRSVEFLQHVFDMRAFQPTADFAILTFGQSILQVHADHTYHSHPLPSLLPENGARGAGAEFRLFDIDPDAAAAKVEGAGGSILQEPTNKPHGLREAFLLDADGYCWVPSRALTKVERGVGGSD